MLYEPVSAKEGMYIHESQLLRHFFICSAILIVYHCLLLLGSYCTYVCTWTAVLPNSWGPPLFISRSPHIEKGKVSVKIRQEIRIQSYDHELQRQRCKNLQRHE
jgi:hypothetical protein